MSPTPIGVLRMEEVEDWDFAVNVTENITTTWQNTVRTFTVAFLLAR
ncbi:MAG TPA: hypothetical protein VN956_15095 [Pyrinomonadaceae bacterium]|nr:hypothetical protein [Pyrinomonadaceae bacterium]